MERDTTPIEIVKKYERNLEIKMEQEFERYDNYNSATVITPTTGDYTLHDVIDSISKQNYKNITHLIVVDGEIYRERTEKIINQYSNENIKILRLPFNVGRNNFNGHRIYAATSFLVNTKYIFFLDEDNWFDNDHVSSMIEFLEKKKLDWAYSMRKIYLQNKVFVAKDNCESIGRYQPYSKNPSLVDTNCYAFKRETITKVAHFWYHPKGVDRYFFEKIRISFPNFACSCKYTVNYRLTDNRPPFASFFINGNKYMLDKYKNQLPWLNRELYTSID